MGRPRKPDGIRHTISVKLDDETYIFVKTVSGELGVPISRFVREIIRLVMEADPEKLRKAVRGG